MTFSIAPHTRIDNAIILNMKDIGVYGFAVYAAIKMHLNQTTGACFPSYATIARMTGINRTTVIDYVKRLRARDLVDPRHRFKEDGSHASNQYDFQGAENPVPSKKVAMATQCQAPEKMGASGSRPVQPEVVASDNVTGRPEPPEQSEGNKKKERTIEEVDFYPTEKQQTCTHPAAEIVSLREDIVVCNHCYSLIHHGEQTAPEIVAA